MVLATETLMSSMGRHPPAERRLIEQVVAYLRHASVTYHDAVDLAARGGKGVNQFGVAKGATGDISSQGKGKGFRNGFDEGEASTGVGKSRVGFVWRGSVAAAMSDDNNDSTGVGQGVCHNSDDGKGVGKGVGKGDDTKGVCKGWGRFARPPNN